jgi:hypothetical protein
VTTASATSIGSSEVSRSGQVRVGFAADGRLDACPALIVCCPSARSRSRTRQDNMAVCRYFYGSDGTRTRDLPRDRRVPQHPAIGDDYRAIALLMRACGPSALISARLRRLDFGRLLPFCCPDAGRSSRRR